MKPGDTVIYEKTFQKVRYDSETKGEKRVLDIREREVVLLEIVGSKALVLIKTPSGNERRSVERKKMDRENVVSVMTGIVFAIGIVGFLMLSRGCMSNEHAEELVRLEIKRIEAEKNVYPKDRFYCEIRERL